MKHIFFVAALLTLLSGCEVFVDFDRALLDGGSDGSSMARVSALGEDLDAGVPDATDAAAR